MASSAGKWASDGSFTPSTARPFLPSPLIRSAESTSIVRGVSAEAEAYATQVVAEAIAKNGLEAAQYQVALKQVEALVALGAGDGKQTIVLPANALDAFADAFTLLTGRKP